jgi:hypothetical protein
MASEEAVDAAVSKIDGSFFQGRRLAARRPLAEGAKAEPTPPRKYSGTIHFFVKHLSL